MRYLMHFLLPFLAVFLQSTVFGFYSIKGTLPDMVLVFVVFFSVINGAAKGTVYGFLCGLLEDLYLGRFIGINAISKALTGFLVGKLQGGFFRENFFIGALAVAIGTLLNALILLLLSRLAFASFHIDKQFFTAVFYQFIYNVILAAPLYGWYYRSSRAGLLRLSREN
ncbi:MAG TPA: rod shape-determining protein MreD [Syntrophomonadaceae bacterium]|nr:rod shape-determining protein MreD [Syntrophomonadaceae bacterium]HNX28253.1 rod shape-determining protein MreD [Syntrophomonadaceae bacterium]HPR92460.1 rod shape-determining protein MreD [Syntrophomonadaceae bacterium]